MWVESGKLDEPVCECQRPSASATVFAVVVPVVQQRAIQQCALLACNAKGSFGSEWRAPVSYCRQRCAAI